MKTPSTPSAGFRTRQTPGARRSRRLLVAAIAGCALLLIPPCRAQTVDRVYPAEPADGARVGTRPKLRVAVEGSDVLKMRFRIEMSRDDFDTIAYDFDQRDEPNGWAFISFGFDEPGALYMARSPLEDGTYDWRVSAWNGIEWIAGKRTRRIVIDGIPPADVDGVRMRADVANKTITLDWDPVVTDQKGDPEQVAKYHVYRYEQRAMFLSIGVFQIAEVEDTHYEDADPTFFDFPLVFYKITAEDEAGNETGRRY
jgi:hypothetical protein